MIIFWFCYLVVGALFVIRRFSHTFNDARLSASRTFVWGGAYLFWWAFWPVLILL